MPATKDGKKDLEAEALARCFKALNMEGRGYRGRYVSKLDAVAVGRILRYLKDRFGVSSV